MIIDGPIFAIIGTLSGLNIGDVLIATFLIEVVAIWGSIGYLALSTSRPTFGQMIASTILSVICIGGIVILYWAAGFFNYERYRYLPLIFGVIESIGIKYWILYKDEVVTESTDGILFIVGNIFLRLVTMVVAGIKVNG